MVVHQAAGRRSVARPRWMAIVLAILTVFVASGCSLLGVSGQSDGGANPRHLEKLTIRVGGIAAADISPLYIALQRGYFAAEGLHVIPVVTQGGAQALPQLFGRNLDITVTNYSTAITAQVKKTGDLRIVFDGVHAGPGILTIDALPDSGIHSIGDLVGRKIGLSSLNDVPEFALEDAFVVNGLDWAKVTPVPIPFQESEQALRTGQVVATAQVEPYITQTERQLGALPVVDPFATPGPNSNMPIAGYVATAQFVHQNPNTLAAFQRAMVRATRDATDRMTVARILPTYTKVDPTVAMLMTMPEFSLTLDPTRLQRVADLMLTYGQLPGPFNVASMIVPVPAGS